MPTFIDESGEPGHVSPYFRLAAVWLPTLDAVEAYRQDIRDFQQQQGIANYEFKFSKYMPQDRRNAFYLTAMGHPFRFTVASIDKHHNSWRNAERSVLHWACAVSVAACLRAVYLEEEQRRAQTLGTDRPLNELVVVDDNQDKQFLTQIKSTFRAPSSGVRAGSPLVGKVKFRGSGPEELIQLADMVCGAVGAHLDGDSGCYDFIADRSLGIIPIP